MAIGSARPAGPRPYGLNQPLALMAVTAARFPKWTSTEQRQFAIFELGSQTDAGMVQSFPDQAPLLKVE